MQRDRWRQETIPSAIQYAVREGRKARPCRTLGHSAAVAAFCRQGYSGVPLARFTRAVLEGSPKRFCSSRSSACHEARHFCSLDIGVETSNRHSTVCMPAGSPFDEAGSGPQASLALPFLLAVARRAVATVLCSHYSASRGGTVASCIGCRTVSPGGSRQPASFLHAAR